MGRRIIPYVVRRPTDTPNDLGPIYPPNLTITSQDTATVTLQATYSASTPAASQYVFQSAAALGGPYTTVATQSASSIALASPAVGVAVYYRAAVIVSDGRQTVWSAIVNTVGFSSSSSRRYAAGHYTALQQTDTGTDSGPFVGIPHAGSITGSGLSWNPVAGPSGVASRTSTGPVSAQTQGIVLRHYFKDLDNDDGTYNLTEIAQELAQADTWPGTLLVFPIIVTKTFDATSSTAVGSGTNPLPPSLASKSIWFWSGTSGGWNGPRWDATVNTRYGQLVAAIGAAFDGHPNFGGISTLETSTGSTASGNTTLDNYLQMLILESNYIRDACPSGRHLAYQNFLDVGTNAQQTAALEQYAAAVQANGGIFGGPDLVTGGGTPASPHVGGLVTRAYPNYTKFHNGTGLVAAPGPTFCSVQHSEFVGQAPADSPVNLPNLFNYGTSSNTYSTAGALDWRTGSPLNLDIIIWNWQQGGATNYSADAVPIMNANPSFGTWTP